MFKENLEMNRKLPVYLVVDCSHSMRGKPIEMVNSGIKRMINIKLSAVIKILCIVNKISIIKKF